MNRSPGGIDRVVHGSNASGVISAEERRAKRILYDARCFNRCFFRRRKNDDERGMKRIIQVFVPFVITYKQEAKKKNNESGRFD
jgi:hypothetical protein